MPGVDFGGFFGLGTTTIAVAWNGLQLVVPTTTDIRNDNPYFLLDVPKETLEQAPATDNLDTVLPPWPGAITPGWNTESDNFWQTAGI